MPKSSRSRAFDAAARGMGAGAGTPEPSTGEEALTEETALARGPGPFLDCGVLFTLRVRRSPRKEYHEHITLTFRMVGK